MGYHSDTQAGAGSGVFLPPDNSCERVWDLVFQLFGWYCNVMIAAQFIRYAEITDQVRQQAENTYFRVNHFFRCAGNCVNNELIGTIMKSFQKTYRDQTAGYERSTFSGLPHCAIKDLVHELHGDTFKKNFFPDPATQDYMIRRLAPFITVLSTQSNTYVLERDQLSDHAFFVAEGEYSIIDKKKNRTLLPPGAHFAPGRKSTHEFISRCDGKLLCVPYEKLKLLSGFKPPKTLTLEKTELANRDLSAHVQFERSLVLVGIVTYFLSAMYWFYRDSFVDDSAPKEEQKQYQYTDCSGFLKAPNCESWNPINYMSCSGLLHFVMNNTLVALSIALDVWLFISVYVKIIRNKMQLEMPVFNKESYNTEELCYLAGSLPLPWHIKWLVRTVWFYVEHVFTYPREVLDIGSDMYTVRVIKYGFCWALFGCVHMIGCISIWLMCPGGVCGEKTMAVEYVNLMERPPNGTFAHRINGDGVYDHEDDYHRASIADTSTLIDTLYTTLDAFSATGCGNIRPHSFIMILIRALTCTLGRIVMGLVLGVSRDITGNAKEGLIQGYIVMRERVRRVLARVGVAENKSRYILGYVDANFERNMHFDIAQAFGNMNISPAMKRDLYYDFYGQFIETADVFAGMSKNAIKEISAAGCRLEDYFAGHIIQDHGTPIDSTMCIKSGAITIGTRRVKIVGESMYEQHIDNKGGVVAESRVIAFTKCEIIKLDHAAIMAVLAFYPEDKARFFNNISGLKRRYM